MSSDYFLNSLVQVAEKISQELERLTETIFGNIANDTGKPEEGAIRFENALWEILWKIRWLGKQPGRVLADSRNAASVDHFLWQLKALVEKVPDLTISGISRVASLKSQIEGQIKSLENTIAFGRLLMQASSIIRSLMKKNHRNVKQMNSELLTIKAKLEVIGCPRKYTKAWMEFLRFCEYLVK